MNHDYLYDLYENMEFDRDDNYDDDLFDFVPDYDGDGDSDLEDYLINEEILEKEEEITSGRSSRDAFRDSLTDIDEDEILLEYGIDRDDYDTLDDYIDAIYEVKYGWREFAEDGSEYGLDPNEFETEEEYQEALENAIESAEDDESDDEEYNNEIGFNLKLVWKFEVNDADNKDIGTNEESSKNTAEGNDDGKHQNSEYDTEEDLEDDTWRKYCFNRFGVMAKDYKTRKEYDAAVDAARMKEWEEKAKARAADPNNYTVYKFCKVSVKCTEKPHYYYFPGNLTLKVGDCVIVPFGSTNEELKATVVAVGECYGYALPCNVNLMKTVIRKLV